MLWDLVDIKFVTCKDFDRVRNHLSNAENIDEFLKALDDMVDVAMSIKTTLIKDGFKK